MNEVASPLRPRWTPRSARVLDRIEQIGIIVLWAWLSLRVVESPNGHAWLALVSETTIVVFVLIRRSTDKITPKIDDWLLALGGSFAPALVNMTGAPLAGLAWLATTLVLAGDMFQIWAKFTLARSFGIAPANRGVKTHGPYRFVRHPMYTGYCVAQIGVLIALPSLYNLCLMIFAWAIQIVRINREERLLSDDPDYREMMGRIRWRLLPGIY